MQWSVPIGAVKGTVIRVHLTFLLFLVWIGASHYLQGEPEAAVFGVVFIVLLFASVLLHEFGHVFAAWRYGIQTPDTTLLPIGGVAQQQRIPERSSKELVVALGGLPSWTLGRLAQVNIMLVASNRLFGNPVLIFIALFVCMGAASKASAAELPERRRAITVRRRSHPV